MAAKKQSRQPQEEIDWRLVDRLASRRFTPAKIAYALGIEETTLRSQAEFSKVYQHGRACGKVRSRPLEWRAAERGDGRMLIRLGKRWLGQSDNPTAGDPEQAITTPSVDLNRLTAEERDGLQRLWDKMKGTSPP
jgi:hypothetical protein